MEQQPNQGERQLSQVVTQKEKQPWRKPQVSYIPLHVTAADSGTTSDGLNLQTLGT